MKKELLPLKRPDFPSIDHTNPMASENIMNEFFLQWELVNDENSRRFRKSLHRIRLCAGLRGFVAGLSASSNLGDHYSWCPSPYWIEHWENNQKIIRNINNWNKGESND